MNTELIDTAAEIVRDPQILINLVSKRVKQLNAGRAPFVKTLPSMGTADIALMEIIAGKVIPKGVEIFPLPKPEPKEEEEKVEDSGEEDESEDTSEDSE